MNKYYFTIPEDLPTSEKCPVYIQIHEVNKGCKFYTNQL